MSKLKNSNWSKDRKIKNERGRIKCKRNCRKKDKGKKRNKNS